MATSQFDFKQYNELMKTANSGLRLFLALRLLEDVESTMRRFNSPLKREMSDIVDEVADLRKRNQEYLAKRDNTTDGSIDSQEHLQQVSTSADAGKVAA
jgi:hypothetical protein